MNSKIKLLFITGTRADVGKLAPFVDAVIKNKNYEPMILVTGMHLEETFGLTYQEVERRFNCKIILERNYVGDVSSIESFSNTAQIISKILEEFNIEIIIVHGDRPEALAGAISGTLSNTIVCHIEGGEISGTVDESLRHAITKLAHIHFPTSEKAALRLFQMGEKHQSVFVSGSHIANIVSVDSLPTLKDVKEKYDIPWDDFYISILHPVTTELEIMPLWVEEYFNTLETINENFLILYPNSDLGHKIILKRMLKIRNKKNFRILPSLRHEAYLRILFESSGIIGNSSSAIHEAPIFGIPAIDYGTRQKGRASGNNIVLSASYQKADLLEKFKTLKKIKLNKKVDLADKLNPFDVFSEFLTSKKYQNISLQKEFQ